MPTARGRAARVDPLDNAGVRHDDGLQQDEDAHRVAGDHAAKLPDARRLAKALFVGLVLFFDVDPVAVLARVASYEL